MNLRIKSYLAREFRKKSAISEKILWERLRNKKFLGLKFHRQYVIDGYIVDFYCHSLRLVIEVDGRIHLRQINDDKFRQKIIEDKGINFFRIGSQEVERGIDSVLDELEDFIKVLPHPQPLSPRERGAGNKLKALTPTKRHTASFRPSPLGRGNKRERGK